MSQGVRAAILPNPRHEVFGPGVTLASIVALLGVVVLFLRADALPLTQGWTAVLDWHWP